MRGRGEMGWKLSTVGWLNFSKKEMDIFEGRGEGIERSTENIFGEGK